ncbi:hypothetical protein COD71_08450 [Bacillus cereus]|nr:hypothetical protein COD71_08450 [Bacillus cereus]
MKKGNPYSQKESPFFIFYKAIHLFIHSYYGAVLGFSFVTVLAKKLYKILHTLSVVFLRNAEGTLFHFLT